jgi:hypothetical protein
MLAVWKRSLLSDQNDIEYSEEIVILREEKFDLYVTYVYDVVYFKGRVRISSSIDLRREILELTYDSKIAGLIG